MTQYATPAPRVPALTRTWAAHVTYQECGVVTAQRTHTVTMTRTAQGFAATVDGREAGVLDAARILSSAHTLTVTHEVLAGQVAA